MSLLGFGIVILHIFILTISYELICKVTKKERYLFIACIFVYQSVAEFFFDFISLAGSDGDVGVAGGERVDEELSRRVLQW